MKEITTNKPEDVKSIRTDMGMKAVEAIQRQRVEGYELTSVNTLRTQKILHMKEKPSSE